MRQGLEFTFQIEALFNPVRLDFGEADFKMRGGDHLNKQRGYRARG